MGGGGDCWDEGSSVKTGLYMTSGRGVGGVGGGVSCPKQHDAFAYCICFFVLYIFCFFLIFVICQHLIHI